MTRHHDLINVFAINKIEARKKVLELLHSYQKKKITIMAVEGADNHYEVEVQYYDEYDICSVFVSEDFKEVEDSEALSLKYIL